MATITETLTREAIRLKAPGLENGSYGERLCVHVADDLARKTPARIYATVTNSPQSMGDGFRDITIKQFANAVNYAAWGIKLQFGESKVFDVIAYIGTPDIRYAIFFYAAIKTGHQVRASTTSSKNRKLTLSS